MAFNAAFGSGLLGGINTQIENANKQKQDDADVGDRAFLAQFQQQAKEYDAKKASQADLSGKIEDYAKELASSANGGQGYDVGPDARAVAKSAVTQGIYNKPEYHDYIQDAYERTHQDFVQNPDKWNMKSPLPMQSQQDSNPEQTAALKRYGQNTDPNYLESVRSGSPQDQYTNLPGAKFGNVNEFINQQAADKARATGQAKLDTASSPQAIELASLKAKLAQQNQLGAFGYNPDGSPIKQDQSQAGSGQPSAQPQQPQQPPTGHDAGIAQPTAPNPVGRPQDAAAQPPTQLPMASTAAGSAPTPTPQGTTPTQQPSSGINIQGPAPAEQQSGLAMPASSLQPPGSPTTQGAQNNSAPPVAPAQSTQIQAMKQQYPAAKGIPERNWDALNRLTPNDQNLVLQMSEGKIPLVPANSSRPAVAQHNAILLSALRDFDPSAGVQRVKTRDQFQNGAEADTVMAINTAMNHVGHLRDAANALQNGDTQQFNKIGNAYAAQLGKPAPTSYGQLEHYVSEELQNIYTGTNRGTLEELNSIKDTLDRNQSPEQFHSTFRNVADLLDGKLSGMNARYQSGMGQAYRPNDWMDDNAKSTYNVLKAYGHNGQPVDNADRPIDPRAIAMLQSNPALAPQFEQQFGVPAKAFIRGQ